MDFKENQKMLAKMFEKKFLQGNNKEISVKNLINKKKEEDELLNKSNENINKEENIIRKKEAEKNILIKNEKPLIKEEILAKALEKNFHLKKNEEQGMEKEKNYKAKPEKIQEKNDNLLKTKTLETIEKGTIKGKSSITIEFIQEQDNPLKIEYLKQESNFQAEISPRMEASVKTIGEGNSDINITDNTPDNKIKDNDSLKNEWIEKMKIISSIISKPKELKKAIIIQKFIRKKILLKKRVYLILSALISNF